MQERVRNNMQEYKKDEDTVGNNNASNREQTKPIRITEKISVVCDSWRPTSNQTHPHEKTHPPMQE